MDKRLVGGKCGQWKCEEQIGSGGFGSVTGWINQSTGERLVIKQCKNVLKPENRVRWINEIQLMNSIDNKNIVSGKPIPPEITQFIKAPEKLLGLEYCASDLRKLLNLRNHCCGLPEQTVLNVLRDVSSGMEFLHNKRIIHRDLKPENILLSYQGNTEPIFKITDLGYAKEVDASSIANSFVGTMHYLAPELYISLKGYTYTADFWSLGTLIFECITGHRPFTLSGVNNFCELGQYMQKKSDEHIYGEYVDAEKDVRFFTEIPSPNYMCKPLLVALKKWLQIALRFDPNRRGDVPIEQSHESECCKTIKNVLKMRIINIFHVMKCKVLSYQVIRQGDTGSTLNQYIKNELEIETHDQLLLLPDSFDELKEDTSLNTICTKIVNPILLFDRTQGQAKFQSAIEIDKVRELIGVSEEKRRVEVLRSYWGQALYYCLKTAGDYSQLLASENAFFKYTLKKWDRLNGLYKDLEMNCVRLESVIDMFNKSHHCDLAHRPEEHEQAGLECIQEWDTLSRFVNLLAPQENFDMFRAEILTKEDRLNQLKELKKADDENQINNKLENIARQAGEKFEQLKETIRMNKSHKHDSKKITDLVWHCMRESENMYNLIYDHLWMLIKFDNELSTSIGKIESQIYSVTKSITSVHEHQRTRQSLTWKLLSTSSPSQKSSSLSLSSLPDVLQEKLESLSPAKDKTTEEIQNLLNESLHRLDQFMGREIEKPKLGGKKSHTIDSAPYEKPTSGKDIRRPSMPVRLDSTMVSENPIPVIKSPISPKKSHLERTQNFEEPPGRPPFQNEISLDASANSQPTAGNHQQQHATFFQHQQQPISTQNAQIPWAMDGNPRAFIEQPPMLTNIAQGQLMMTAMASPRTSPKHPSSVSPNAHAHQQEHNAFVYSNNTPAVNKQRKHTLTHTIGAGNKSNFEAVKE